MGATAERARTDTERLAQANAILHCFAPNVDLERVNGRLWLAYRDERWSCRKAAVLSRDGSSLACRYGDLDMGGTCAAATAQLVRWLRGESRLPLSSWRYWSGRTVYLARERGPEMLALLEASDYPDPAKTCCVLCGAARIGDWWSLDGVVGPCCSGREGCRQTRRIAPAAARESQGNPLLQFAGVFEGEQGWQEVESEIRERRAQEER